MPRYKKATIIQTHTLSVHLARPPAPTPATEPQEAVFAACEEAELGS